jgi:asparagine synthase (glutamine-hydrolysing)
VAGLSRIRVANGATHIRAGEGFVLGTLLAKGQDPPEGDVVQDRSGADHYAIAAFENGRPLLERDFVGVAPLYFGRNAAGALCFASEVKALVEATSDVHELPPGCRFDGRSIERYAQIEKHPPMAEPP